MYPLRAGYPQLSGLLQVNGLVSTGSSRLVGNTEVELSLAGCRAG